MYVGNAKGESSVIPVKTGINLHATPDRAITRGGERPQTQALFCQLPSLPLCRAKREIIPYKRLRFRVFDEFSVCDAVNVSDKVKEHCSTLTFGETVLSVK